ncbi:U-actitoxin-Avd3s [Drosophila serrata]|uniref:U-actitoxin-Avd3s n=1 Tax=Drosophila serrata TaxID=7274 RepID=UPI000A1CF389|nr:U-actitoxin-Avd3s [Drosophila serrata]
MRSTTLILLVAVVVLYLLMVLTQVESCKGKPSSPKCVGSLDVGNDRRRKCKRSANKNMWHYNTVTKNCTKLNYKGCGGNDNRWCNKQLCEACRGR